MSRCSKTCVLLFLLLETTPYIIILAQQPDTKSEKSFTYFPEISASPNSNVPISQQSKTLSTVSEQSIHVDAATQYSTSKDDITPTATAQNTESTPLTSTPRPYPLQPDFPTGVGNWFADSNDSKCIIIKGAFLLIAKIDGKNNTKISETIEVPILADAVGNCSDTSQSISLIWYVPSSDKTKTLENILHLEFETSISEEYSEELDKSSSIEHYYLSFVNFTFSPQQFPDYKENAPDILSIAKETTRFQTPLDKSYSCIHEESITFEDNNIKYQGQLSMANVQFQSFRTDSNNDNFGPRQKCKADKNAETSKTFLIGVAATIPILLVILYLYSRFRLRLRVSASEHGEYGEGAGMLLLEQ